MKRLLRFGCLAAAFVISSGCASVDFDYPKDESYVLTDTGDTYLGRQLEPIVASHPADQSGFYPMTDGINALAIRLLMVRNCC